MPRFFRLNALNAFFSGLHDVNAVFFKLNAVNTTICQLNAVDAVFFTLNAVNAVIIASIVADKRC